MWKDCLKRIAEELGYEIRRRPRPGEGSDTRALFTPDENDVYIVSYPRSGNTWMRALTAELLYGESGDSIKSLDYLIPDTHIQLFADEVVSAKPRFVKSHFPLNIGLPSAHYRKVVYLVRDPRSVVLSHYRYQEKLCHYKFGFERFIHDWLSGRIWPCSWQEHVASWTYEGVDTDTIRLLILRYEDLVRDTEAQLRRMSDTFDLNLTDDAIRRATASATVSQMRRKEAAGMRDTERADGFRFIGPATTDGWKSTLTSRHQSLVERYAEESMRRFGYLVSA